LRARCELCCLGISTTVGVCTTRGLEITCLQHGWLPSKCPVISRICSWTILGDKCNYGIFWAKCDLNVTHKDWPLWTRKPDAILRRQLTMGKLHLLSVVYLQRFISPIICILDCPCSWQYSLSWHLTWTPRITWSQPNHCSRCSAVLPLNGGRHVSLQFATQR
jgi:hypothetical protein